MNIKLPAPIMDAKPMLSFSTLHKLNKKYFINGLRLRTIFENLINFTPFQHLSTNSGLIRTCMDPVHLKCRTHTTEWDATYNQGCCGYEILASISISIIHRFYMDIHGYIHIHRRLFCIHVSTEYLPSTVDLY